MSTLQDVLPRQKHSSFSQKQKSTIGQFHDIPCLMMYSFFSGPIQGFNLSWLWKSSSPTFNFFVKADVGWRDKNASYLLCLFSIGLVQCPTISVCDFSLAKIMNLNCAPQWLRPWGGSCTWWAGGTLQRVRAYVSNYMTKKNTHKKPPHIFHHTVLAVWAVFSIEYSIMFNGKMFVLTRSKHLRNCDIFP